MENLKYWDKVSTPPPDALKTIKAGRLKGFTDVSPMWRYKIMTEVYGMCGFGWKFNIINYLIYYMHVIFYQLIFVNHIIHLLLIQVSFQLFFTIAENATFGRNNQFFKEWYKFSSIEP